MQAMAEPNTKAAQSDWAKEDMSNWLQQQSLTADFVWSLQR